MCTIGYIQFMIKCCVEIRKRVVEVFKKGEALAQLKNRLI